MATKLEQLDSKFWKTLKKNAGIKSSKWFKKADASIGKRITELNKARRKFLQTTMIADLLSYQTALDKLAVAFDKFADKKDLDAIPEGDLKKPEKDALLKNLKMWTEEIEETKTELDRKIQEIGRKNGGSVKKMMATDSGKKIEDWKRMGLNI